MKGQVDYFEKCIKILKELKKDHPDVDISKHYSLATDGEAFNLTDKELFLALQRHQSELDMNTLSDRDLQKVIDDTESLFEEVDEDSYLDEEDPSWGDPSY